VWARWKRKVESMGLSPMIQMTLTRIPPCLVTPISGTTTARLRREGVMPSCNSERKFGSWFTFQGRRSDCWCEDTPISKSEI
jgi:hypothetical protein